MERITLNYVLKKDEMAKTHQLDVHESVHCNTSMKVTIRCNYTG
jgi:hypothetical protein